MSPHIPSREASVEDDARNNVADLMGAEARAILDACQRAVATAELANKSAERAESMARLARDEADSAKRGAWAAKQSVDRLTSEVALMRSAMQSHGAEIANLSKGVLEAIAYANNARRAAERASDTSEVTGRFASLAVQREQLDLQEKQEQILARARRRERVWALVGQTVAWLTVGGGIVVLLAGAARACGG